MGEKETLSGEEAALLKPKTKSNQSNDRMAAEGDTEAGDAAAGDDSAEVLKNKTKSNQSNDRMAVGDEAGEAEGERRDGPRTADQGFREGAAGDLDGDGPPEAAINNSHSNIKNLRDADSDGDGIEDARINNTKSNIGKRTGNFADGDSPAAKLAPERPVKSEIAIGEPGVNGNLAGSDSGVPADRPSST